MSIKHKHSESPEVDCITAGFCKHACLCKGKCHLNSWIFIIYILWIPLCWIFSVFEGLCLEQCLCVAGRSYSVFSQRMLNQCLESLVQKIQSGVVINFEKTGPDPPPLEGKKSVFFVQWNFWMTAEETDIACSVSVWGNSCLKHSLCSWTDAAPELLKSGPQPWHCCHKLIYVRPNPKTGVPIGHWPIPEAFWPDQNSPTLVRNLYKKYTHMFLGLFFSPIYKIWSDSAVIVRMSPLFNHAAPPLSPPTHPFLLCGRWAHGDRQSALRQVWVGAFAAHTVYSGEEIPSHLLAGMLQTHMEMLKQSVSLCFVLLNPDRA